MSVGGTDVASKIQFLLPLLLQLFAFQCPVLKFGLDGRLEA